MIFESKNYYDPQQFYQTKSGAKIHRKNSIFGSSNIHLVGKDLFLQKVMIRADYCYIQFGKFVILMEGSAIRPAYRRHKEKVDFLPLNISDYTIIGQNSVLQALQIGSHVNIGKNCVIGNRAVIQDHVRLLQNSVVPTDSTLTSYGLYGGVPAKLINDLPQSWGVTQQQLSISIYNSYMKRPQRKTRPKLQNS